METTGSNSSNKSTRWVVIGCAAIAVCALVACGAIIGGFYWTSLQTAEEVAVRWDIPATMEAGSEVEFRIVITNIASEMVELNSIDISQNYLFGIVIHSTEPAYTEAYQYSWMGETFQTYYFDVSIPAEETVTIVFNGRAVRGGDYSGSMEVCINAIFNCKRNIIRTIIE
jgi:hypothetical protein